MRWKKRQQSLQWKITQHFTLVISFQELFLLYWLRITERDWRCSCTHICSYTKDRVHSKVLFLIVPSQDTVHLLLIKEIKLLILIAFIAKVFDDDAAWFATAHNTIVPNPDSAVLFPPASTGPAATLPSHALASNGKDHWLILRLKLIRSSNSVTVIFKSTDRILWCVTCKWRVRVKWEWSERR